MQATLSHYRVLEQIGQGGMGVVYRAHDERLDRDVALKVLPAGVLANESARKHFRKEALALSKLNHPNIATVHDFNTQEETDFLVEELIPGLSLSEVLISEPLPEREIIHLGVQLCEGLAAAHEQGIIHRDLKPGNIRVTPDARLKILDFGLAKVLHTATPGSDTGATASLTETQTVSGTFPYMAPEQLRNAKPDARSDIWAVGCVLYEMATGQRPFLGYGPNLIDAILHEPPKPPSTASSRVAPGLETIILKCLEKNPTLRYASARDIAVDLHRLSTRSSSVTQGLPARGRTPLLSRRILLGACAVGLIAALVGVSWRWLRSRRTPVEGAVPSVAVLPFVNMSADPQQEYFSDGLTEEVLNQLTTVPGLRVAARTSAFQFKGKYEDLRAVAQKLNVSAVLEGSVRREGKRLRITVQLINAADGFQLWSRTYDRELTDVFLVQEDIARMVASELRGTFVPKPPLVTRTVNTEAYNAYLQGRQFLAKGTPESIDQALASLSRSVELDPGFAPAWAALARANIRRYGVLSYRPSLTRDEVAEAARTSARRALALEPQLAAARVVSADVKFLFDWDWVGAESEARQALQLQPGSVEAFRSLARISTQIGRMEDALQYSRRAVEYDPLNPLAYSGLGYMLYGSGHYEEAAAAFRRVLELAPHADVHPALGAVYLMQSRPREALREFEKAEHLSFRYEGLAMAYYALGMRKESDQALQTVIDRKVAAFQVMEIYAYRGEKDLAFEWLQQSYDIRDAGLAIPGLKNNPLLKKLEDDPRYAAFLKKMHLPSD